jgi:hypothetical protein
LERQHEVARRDGPPLDRVDLGQQLLDERDAARHALRGAPGLLDGEAVQARILLQACLWRMPPIWLVSQPSPIIATAATWAVGLASAQKAQSRANSAIAKLWVCTCWPGSMSCLAAAMIWL